MRGKTDSADAHLIRELLAQGRLPESWMPPVVSRTNVFVRMYTQFVARKSRLGQSLEDSSSS